MVVFLAGYVHDLSNYIARLHIKIFFGSSLISNFFHEPLSNSELNLVRIKLGSK
jgi:hypothetical protein